MDGAAPGIDRIQQRQQARFRRMGLSVRAMPDGRSLLVSMPFGSSPLASIAGPLEIGRVIFSTVGADHIKCLRPRPLFGLPQLDIRRCADTGAIEDTIRQAWRDRTRELRDSGRMLGALGVDVSAAEGGSVLGFPLPGEPPGVRVMMQRIGEAILPSAGPLGGLPLAAPEERLLEVSGSLDSSADLEFFLDQRMAELREHGRRAEADRRHEAGQRAVEERDQQARRKQRLRREPSHRPRVLIVGTQLIEDAPLRQELKRQGYRAATSRSETEALMRLAGSTPDLVIAQYRLGRSDGATLVQAMRGLPGIERIPVVLLDESLHASRKEAARAVGAAGYLVEPVEADRFVTRLGSLLARPADRRFTRYAGRLVTRIDGAAKPFLATEVGRGGLFLATPEALDTNVLMRGELSLPEFRRALRFHAEVLYRSDPQGTQRQGVGLRFCGFAAEDEAQLIEYLAWLESRD